MWAHTSTQTDRKEKEKHIWTFVGYEKLLCDRTRHSVSSYVWLVTLSKDYISKGKQNKQKRFCVRFENETENKKNIFFVEKCWELKNNF